MILTVQSSQAWVGFTPGLQIIQPFLVLLSFCWFPRKGVLNLIDKRDSHVPQVVILFNICHRPSAFWVHMQTQLNLKRKRFLSHIWGLADTTLEFALSNICSRYLHANFFSYSNIIAFLIHTTILEEIVSVIAFIRNTFQKVFIFPIWSSCFSQINREYQELEILSSLKRAHDPDPTIYEYVTSSWRCNETISYLYNCLWNWKVQT